MINEGVRWGMIHCGTKLRILRIEYEQHRPYAIISGEILPHTPARSSAYSLICYMLLTGKTEVPIFDDLKKSVPTPPPVTEPGRLRPRPRIQSPKLMHTSYLSQERVSSVCATSGWNIQRILIFVTYRWSCTSL